MLRFDGGCQQSLPPFRRDGSLREWKYGMAERKTRQRLAKCSGARSWSCALPIIRTIPRSWRGG